MARLRCSSAALVLIFAAAPSALAGEVSFDELPPVNGEGETLSEQYAHLGVHFRTTDDGAVWAGSPDDPGGWGLEGSNGPAFAGFDGASYRALLSFDAPVTGFELDVARASQSRFGDTFDLIGLRGGALVERVHVRLGDVGEWIGVGLLAEVDQVLWFGSGFMAHSYGVDNLRWVGGPEVEDTPLPCEIDLLPGSEGNPVRTGRRGVIPLVIRGTETLDVEEIDAASLALGRDGAPVTTRPAPRTGDHDGDGRLDLFVHHRVEETGLRPGDTEVCLTGQLWDGTPVEGCDGVTPVGRPR